MLQQLFENCLHNYCCNLLPILYQNGCNYHGYVGVPSHCVLHGSCPSSVSISCYVFDNSLLLFLRSFVTKPVALVWVTWESFHANDRPSYCLSARCNLFLVSACHIFFLFYTHVIAFYVIAFYSVIRVPKEYFIFRSSKDL